MWRKKPPEIPQEQINCREVQASLERYLDGHLSAATLTAFEAHLAQCPDCRRRVREEPLWLGRLRQWPARERLTAVEAAAIRKGMYRGMRWRMIVRDTKSIVQGVAAFAALVVVIGLFVWWQQQDDRAAPPAPQPTAQAAGGMTPAAGQATITLAVDEANLVAYRPLVEQFEAQHSNIRVRLVTVLEIVSSEEPDRIAALASAADVFAYSPNRQGGAQYLLDLRPFLDLNPQFDPSDFHSGLLPPASEPLWAIPTEAMYYVTFYDERAFDAAGLPYPEPDWTPEAFLDAAQTLTQREDGEVTRWGYIPGQLRYSLLLAAQLNAPLVGVGGSRLADPDVVAAVQWTADLFTRHQVAPWLEDYKPAGMRSGGGLSAMGLVDDGMAAMWQTTHVLFDPNSEHMGVTAVPHNQAGVPAEPIVSGFAVSRGAASPQAAWQLLDFLSRQPPLNLLPYPVNPVPARQSVAAAVNYWQQIPQPLLSALQYTVANNLPPRITSPEADSLLQALVEHIDDGVPVAEALGGLPAPLPAPPESEEPVIVVPTPLPQDDEETVRITFATENGVIEAHRRLANQFQQEHPDIAVQIIAKNISLRNPLDQIAGSDCFVGEYGLLGNDDAREALLPLTPLLQADETFQLEAYYPVLVEPLLVDGELLGLPAWMPVPYIEYNRDLFTEAGIPDPSLDWTLDDFLEIARQLTTGDGETKQYGYAEVSHYFWLGWSQAFGVDLLDNSAAVPDLNYDAAAPMVAWHADLIRLQIQPLIGGIDADDLDIADFDQFHALIRGRRLAMWPGGSAFGAVMRTGAPLNFEVGVAAQPIGPGGYRGLVQEIMPNAYHIALAASTPQRQACWQWLKFLSAQSTAVQVNAATSNARVMPAYIEAAESEAFASLVGPQMAAIFQDFMNFPAVAGARPIPQLLAWMRPGENWLREAYWQAATEQATVAEALADARLKFSQYRQCIIDDNAFDDRAGRLACLDAVDPALRVHFITNSLWTD